MSVFIFRLWVVGMNHPMILEHTELDSTLARTYSIPAEPRFTRDTTGIFDAKSACTVAPSMTARMKSPLAECHRFMPATTVGPATLLHGDNASGPYRNSTRAVASRLVGVGGGPET